MVSLYVVSEILRLNRRFCGGCVASAGNLAHWRGWLNLVGKFAFIKSLISQDASSLCGILWREICAILAQLRRDSGEI